MYILNTRMIGCRNIGIDVVDDLSICEPHSHEFFEIAYTVNGTAVYSKGNIEEKISAGDYIIMQPGDMHYYTKCGNENLTVINCIFTSKFINSKSSTRSFAELISGSALNINTNLLTKSPTEHIFHDKDGYILQLFKILKAEYNNKNSNYYKVMKNILFAVITSAMREISKTSNTNMNLVDYIKDYVSYNYQQDNILSRISDATGYSIQYISTKFKEDTGETFKTYLQHTRINLAKELLIKSPLSISDIAYNVGYQDTKYFTQLFKKYINQPPSQWRTLSKKEK